MSRPTYIFTPAEDSSVDDTYNCVEDPSLSIQLYDDRYIVWQETGNLLSTLDSEEKGSFDTLSKAIGLVETIIKEGQSDDPN